MHKFRNSFRWRELTLLVLLSTLNYPATTTFAQGSAFTYQGRLNDGANPANGIYDIRFAIYDSLSGGIQQGNFITNSGTSVSNGLFTVTLDFGNQFPGANRWLDIGVRTNGNGAFASLTPRQLLTSTPYAVQAANSFSASSVQAGGIIGTIPLAQLPTVLVTNGASGVNFTGTFTGNGAGVTNVALTSLNSQGFINWQGNFLSSVPLLTGSTFFSVVLTNIIVPTNMAGSAPPELLTTTGLGNSVEVFTNNGKGNFVLVTNVPAGSGPGWLAVADLNGDGRLDVVVANLLTNFLTILTNDGHGGLVVSSSPAIDAPAFCVVAADVNGDGKPDLIAGNTFTSNTLSVLTNDGHGGFVVSSKPVVGLAPATIVAADINGDGKVDLMCVNNGSNSVSVLTNDGSGGFVLAATLPVGPSPEALVAADINGDGKPDLICADEGDNKFFVYTNTGSGGFIFASTNSLSTNSSPTSIQAVDLNGDGKLELVCEEFDGTIQVLTNNGASGFGVTLTTTLKGGTELSEGLALADINGDGKPDVISADTFDSTIWLLLNSPTYEGTFLGDGSHLTSLTASNIIGILPQSALAGTYSNAVTFNNAAGNFSGNFSGSFSGNGSGLQNLNASQLTSGTVPSAAMGGVYSGIVDFGNGNNVFSGLFNGDGSGLLNLNASHLTTGTITGSVLNGADGSGLVNLNFSQLAGTLPNSALAGTYSGAVLFNNASFNIFDGTFFGNGNGLANLNASQLTGVVPNASLSGTYPNALTLNNAGNSFTGNGSGLTSLNASQLGSGTVPDGRLSANVALRAGGNTFNGTQIITNGSVGIGTTSTGANNVQINPTFFTANGYGLVVDRTDFGEDIQVTRTNGQGGIGLAIDDGFVPDSSTAMLLIRDNVASSPQTLFDVLGSGNVGIGTASPQQFLQVGDSTILGSQGMIRVASRANGGSAARIWDFGCPIDATNASDTAGKNFSFVVQDTASIIPNFLIRWDTHFVGIACTNPINLLTVGGAVSPPYCDGVNWVNGSDRNAKEDFSPVDPREVLAKVAALPLTEWQYKATPGQAHLGPMAQDFHAAFGLNGSDDKHISTVDEGGVALAAIQGLNQKLEAENAELKARLEKLEQIIYSQNEKP